MQYIHLSQTYLKTNSIPKVKTVCLFVFFFCGLVWFGLFPILPIISVVVFQIWHNLKNFMIFGIFL